MANRSFSFDFSEILRSLDQATLQAEFAVEAHLENEAMELTNYAKDHARWTNRTGDARRRLNTTVEKVPNGYRMALAHGVDYGIWLELANQREYAIIDETINTKGPDIIRSFNGMMSELFGRR